MGWAAMQEPCAYHPDRPAISVCSGCGAFLCDQCDLEGDMGFEVYCSRCLPKPVVEPLARPAPARPLARLAAFFLDNLLLDAAHGVLASLLGIAVDPNAQALTQDMLWSMAIIAGLSAVYFTLSWVRFGASLGKAFVGIRVVRWHDGGPVTLSMALVRWGGFFLTLVTFGIGYLTIFLDPERRAWYDRLAGTVVVER